MTRANSPRSFDDEGARNGWCLYELGCKGPTTYNACATIKWNGGTSFPIESGHGCLGCSEPGFLGQRQFLFARCPAAWGKAGEAAPRKFWSWPAAPPRRRAPCWGCRIRRRQSLAPTPQRAGQADNEPKGG
jgi:hypothetical protein